jgi:hypothetical protein
MSFKQKKTEGRKEEEENMSLTKRRTEGGKEDQENVCP